MRYNATFRYSTPQEPQRDPVTGFYAGDSGSSEWTDGGMCQVDNSQQHQVNGTDGQMHKAPYTVFIPKGFKGSLSIGDQIQVTLETGSEVEFIIEGVDDLNRKYTEIWG